MTGWQKGRADIDQLLANGDLDRVQPSGNPTDRLLDEAADLQSDMADEEQASVLLRRARRSAGLTQRQLAELAATSQPALAAYESGAREPTLPVLQRMIRATGHVLNVTIASDPRVFRLADLADQIQATKDEQRRMRLVFEFLRGADEDGAPVRLLVAAEPAPTGDTRFDALFAEMPHVWRRPNLDVLFSSTYRDRHHPFLAVYEQCAADDLHRQSTMVRPPRAQA